MTLFTKWYSLTNILTYTMGSSIVCIPDPPPRTILCVCILFTTVIMKLWTNWAVGIDNIIF